MLSQNLLPVDKKCSLLHCVFAACHTLYSEFNLTFFSLLNVNVSYTQKCKTSRELSIYFVSKLSSLWGTLWPMQLNRGISMEQTVCILSTILWNHFILLLMLWRLTFCFEQWFWRLAWSIKTPVRMSWHQFVIFVRKCYPCIFALSSLSFNTCSTYFYIFSFS